MAISVFPVAVASTGPNASAITAASANTLYSAAYSYAPGIYTISCASGTVARVQFLSDTSTVITTATTSSGTVTINLGTAADRVRV